MYQPWFAKKMQYFVLVPILINALAALVYGGAAPLEMAWNTITTFGPDGPWQAVLVTIGSNNLSSPTSNVVNLYPGGSFNSQVLTSAFCNGSSSGCLAAGNGLYNASGSSSSIAGVLKSQPGLGQWDSGDAMNITGSGSLILDTFQINSPSTTFKIPNSTFGAIDILNNELPNGQFYPSQVGNLALGAPNFDQFFSLGNGANITGNMLTGWLKENGDIPSSSWGLHIGSVQQGQPGSLLLGGYDQSRALGNVGAFDTNSGNGAVGEPVATLLDVTLGVETGGTPFNTTNIGSLLRAGGNTSAPVVINPTLPYMYLPFGTCEAIAEFLPVTWQRGSGLYIWNQEDPKYRQIVTSPAFLQFVFRQSATSNLTIKVPFALLNLTLETPIVPFPQPYFPCKPIPNRINLYYLGRAFLQAAYFGMNWEQSKFFLAQAPGPNSGPTQIQPFQSSDVSMQSSPIDAFTDTWAAKWTPLPTSSTAPTANPTQTASSLPGTSAADSGLATGAKVGISIGVVLIALAIIGATFMALRYIQRKRRHADRLAVQPYPREKPHPPSLEERENNPIQELEVPHVAYEIGDNMVAELGSRHE